MIRAIFFDFNGVIINDERIHLQAYREVLRSECVDLSDEDYFASLGMDDVAFVRAAFARAGKQLEDENLHSIIQREHERHRELIKDELPVESGVVTFIKAASRYFQVGLVSMAVRSEIDHVLRQVGLDNVFTVFVTAGQVASHKPAPDCYRRALELLNEKRCAMEQQPVLAIECLVVEDAPPGIEAARGAGMRTLGVTNTVSESELRAAGAEVVTVTLADWTLDAVHLVFN